MPDEQSDGLAMTGHGVRILIGDVRGKGLGAVQITAQILATFRERASDSSDPNDLMRHLEETAVRCATPEDFVTAALVQVGADGTLQIANAGHPPPLLLTRGTARWLEPDQPSPPLGLGIASPGLLHDQLKPGDRLLRYTDGLTEARRPARGEFLPPELITTAASAADLDAAIRALVQLMLDWTHGQPNDDVALVLLQYIGPRSRP